MKKVGIITVHRLPNWGSVMQGYALQKVIEKLGYNCECVDYIYPNEWHISKGCWSPQHISLKNKIARFLGFRPPLLSSLVDEFIKNEMNVSRCYRSYDEIHKNPPCYDIYVSGSDQIWNWKTMYMDTTYLLDFAPKKSRIISYSSSFSVNTIPAEYRSIYINCLKRYDAISVRENGGNVLVSDLLNTNAKVVLDPTLLLNKEDWKQLEIKANWKSRLPEKYILCYTLGYTYNPIPAMCKLLHSLQSKYNCPVIFIGRKLSDYDGDVFRFERNQGIGVYEFLWLVSHATVFATSSFHGTAFSVNLGTPFLSLVEKKEQSDDRISSFLKDMGLIDHLVTVKTEFEHLKHDETYDVVSSQKKLQKLRLQSLEWLQNALNGSCEEQKSLC